VERGTPADAASALRWMALTETPLVRELRELIAALDRRVPHVERAGEISIAKDAAALKAKALQRLAELEHDAATTFR
jgi:hypothetical protein